MSFIRSWAEYRDGFGDKEGSFWLGNEILRRLTEPVAGEKGWQMRVRLNLVGQLNNQSGVYNDFRVDGEKYTLHVGTFKDNPQDPLGKCAMTKFVTIRMCSVSCYNRCSLPLCCLIALSFDSTSFS